MPDELPEGHIRMADKWAKMGAPKPAPAIRRGRASAEPDEVTEEAAESVPDEDKDTETAN